MLQWRISPGSHNHAVPESYQLEVTSIHGANGYMFRWFIYVGSGEYKTDRIPAAILRELGWRWVVHNRRDNSHYMPT